jgi:hypothetical protein
MGVRSTSAAKRWSPAQAWALTNHACIGEIVDDGARSDLPLLERPGLVRLAQLTLPSLCLPGPVLVEAPDTVDALTKAVIAEYLTRGGQDLYFGPYGRSAKPVTAMRRRTWTQAARATLVEETVEQLEQTAKDWMVSSGSLDPIILFGSGQLRDVKLARQVAIERHDAGWTKRKIRDYLELYGFQNFSGTIGRWPHDQLVRLMSAAS